LNCADTNWLVSVYIEPDPADAEALKRRKIVDRYMRAHGGPLIVSHIVLLEARNIFSRITGEKHAREWQTLESDFEGRLYVDTMNWDLLRRECGILFSKYAWRTPVGTFDTAVVASVKLAGGTNFLSFDSRARGIAVAEGLNAYPPLNATEKQFVSLLKYQRK
jgi:hypothetical protein